MAIDISAELAQNNAAYADLQSKFASSIFNFETISLDPGNGFDIDYWINQLEAPTFTAATITQTTVPTTTVALPDVVPPEFVPPETIVALSAGGYDSAYLEEMEQTIRTLTADILDSVIPASLYDNYFKVDRAAKARAIADEINDTVEKHASRRFPSIPMVTVRDAMQSIEKWQLGEYAHQDKTAQDRVDLAKKMYFSSIQNGIDIEALRAKLIFEYAKFFSDHNRTLVQYYRELMDEKLTEARLTLDNVNANLAKEKQNIELQQMDNSAELELPSEVLKRSFQRIELSFKIDEEMVERRRKCMQKICETYSGWATGVLGQTQGMTTARHNVAVSP